MRNLICLLLLILPTGSGAESTISCHCFQDRSFNHQDTAAADPYFLATTQNNFLALIYGIDKRAIVKAKMAGTSGSHLWILFDVAKRSQKTINQVEKLYAKSQRWTDIFRELKLSPAQLGENYWQLGNNPEQLTDHIVNLQLRKYFSVTADELKVWRKQGMGRKELILALLLEGSPATLHNQVASGMQTWGKLLYEQGLLDGKAINQKLKRQLSQS